MISITPYSCPPYAINCIRVNGILPSSSISFSNFNIPPHAPTRRHGRISIVLASADEEKQLRKTPGGLEKEPQEMLERKFGQLLSERPQKTFAKQRKTARGLETEPLEMLELKFGQLLGENPQKTLSKVLERKSNPDASYLEIEKSMKARHGLHLKRPLQSSSTEGKERPLTNFSNGQSVSSNTKGSTKSLSLNRPVMRREGKKVISPVEPNRLGSDAKTIHMESDSKEVTHEVLLRRPSKQTHEYLGFAGQPTTPHLPSKKIQDSAKRSLEDSGLLRRPEAIRVDYNLGKRDGDSKDKEAVTEDSLGSKTDSSNTYAAAENEGEAKRESRISLNRPTLLMNPIVLTSYEIDSQELHDSTKNENRLQRSVSESKGDGSSFRSRKPESIGRAVPSSTKSDKMSKADINIPSLITTPRAKIEVRYRKEQLQDRKEATEIKAEEPSDVHEV